MGYVSCCTFLTFPYLLVLLGTPSAFVAPGGGRAFQNPTGDWTSRVAAHHRPLRELSKAPRAQAATPAAVAVGPAEEEVRGPAAHGGKLSGKEAVEQAAERLMPVFAEVDAHTQRWVLLFWNPLSYVHGVCSRTAVDFHRIGTMERRTMTLLSCDSTCGLLMRYAQLRHLLTSHDPEVRAFGEKRGKREAQPNQKYNSKSLSRLVKKRT